MVANSARWIYEGGELGYDDYYNIFSNNIPVTWVLYKLYSLSASMTSYPYNPEFIWIQYQCILLTLAVVCTAFSALLISRNIGISTITLGLVSLLFGLSPWKMVPYTDGCSIVFPALVLFLYCLFRRSRSRCVSVMVPAGTGRLPGGHYEGYLLCDPDRRCTGGSLLDHHR